MGERFECEIGVVEAEMGLKDEDEMNWRLMWGRKSKVQ